MKPYFYSLEFIIRRHLAERVAKSAPPACFRPYCDQAFFDALANEENQ